MYPAPDTAFSCREHADLSQIGQPMTLFLISFLGSGDHLQQSYNDNDSFGHALRRTWGGRLRWIRICSYWFGSSQIRWQRTIFVRRWIWAHYRSLSSSVSVSITLTMTLSDLYFALTPLVGNATKTHDRQSHTREHAQAITHEDTKFYVVRQLCVPPQKKISAVIL